MRQLCFSDCFLASLCSQWRAILQPFGLTPRNMHDRSLWSSMTHRSLPKCRLCKRRNDEVLRRQALLCPNPLFVALPAGCPTVAVLPFAPTVLRAFDASFEAADRNLRMSSNVSPGVCRHCRHSRPAVSPVRMKSLALRWRSSWRICTLNNRIEAESMNRVTGVVSESN